MKKKPLVSPSSDFIELRFEADTNEVAQFFSGPLSKNLHRIEKCLGARLDQQGNTFLLHIPKEKQTLAKGFMADLLKYVQSQKKPLEEIDIKTFWRLHDSPTVNESLISEDQAKSLQEGFLAEDFSLKTPLRVIRPRTPGQAGLIECFSKNDISFVEGPAGTGKTFLAVAYAVAQLHAGSARRLIFSRPAVEAGEALGFLPGDIKEKVDPYLRPIYDALHMLMPSAAIEEAMAAGVIEIAPLAFMRGRTLSNACVILDEAQNTTTTQMKMFLTRLGEKSKMIICGDGSQADLPSQIPSGLVEAMAALKNIKGISVFHFGIEDVVRHSLITPMLSAFSAYHQTQQQQKK